MTQGSHTTTAKPDMIVEPGPSWRILEAVNGQSRDTGRTHGKTGRQGFPPGKDKRNARHRPRRPAPEAPGPRQRHDQGEGRPAFPGAAADFASASAAWRAGRATARGGLRARPPPERRPARQNERAGGGNRAGQRRRQAQGGRMPPRYNNKESNTPHCYRAGFRFFGPGNGRATGRALRGTGGREPGNWPSVAKHCEHLHKTPPAWWTVYFGKEIAWTSGRARLVTLTPWRP